MEEADVFPKVWGEEQVICNGPLYCAKWLFVNPGFLCSTHRHLVKDETFICIAGSGFISVDGQVRAFSEGDRQHVPPGTWHYFGSVDGMTLLEVSTHHEDADVERRDGHPSRAIANSDKELWEIYRG